MKYLCHRLPQMYYVCRGDNHTILSSFMNYHHIFNKSNITGARWSRGCFSLRSNWVRTQFLMGFLLLSLQLFNFLCHVFPIIFLLIFRWSLNCLYFGLPIPFGIFKIFLMLHFWIIHWNIPQWTNWVRSGRDRMVVGYITTYAISVYHHWRCKFESHSGDVYSIQHYAIKFVSDIRRVGGFLWVLRFPPSIKLTATI